MGWFWNHPLLYETYLNWENTKRRIQRLEENHDHGKKITEWVLWHPWRIRSRKSDTKRLLRHRILGSVKPEMVIINGLKFIFERISIMFEFLIIRWKKYEVTINVHAHWFTEYHQKIWVVRIKSTGSDVFNWYFKSHSLTWTKFVADSLGFGVPLHVALHI